jgi:UDP-N-acetylmuramate--alanine ligase
MAEYRNIYFIGIGGIGMSAIARYYNFKGLKVSGYDKTPSDLTRALESEGIDVHYEDNVSYIPEDVENTLVIYTPAIPKDMGELTYVQEKGYRVIKRSRMLGEIAEGQRCLAVAGTHGKTTTSTLLAHIFSHSGEGCSAFLGGISKNYNTNLLVSHNNVIVAEADEFDRSFLQLYPEIAVITSMDADHLDIYGDASHIHEAFKAFASQVSGTVVVKHGLDIVSDDTKATILTYSYDNPQADFHASDIVSDECGYFTFTLNSPYGKIENCRLGIPGWINTENAIAASAISLIYGLEPERIRKALAAFEGVKRRFDIHLNTPSCSYIDDYAHHPKEISSAISSMRNIFPGRKLTAVFQPHLYTRTRDFAPEFAESLSMADKLILLDIYPAREEPIEGVTSEIIFDKVTLEDKVLITREQLMDYLQNEPVDILVTFGAGNIDRFISPITEMLKKRSDEKSA